jgi:hypothetical protein
MFCLDLMDSVIDVAQGLVVQGPETCGVGFGRLSGRRRGWFVHLAPSAD